MRFQQPSRELWELSFKTDLGPLSRGDNWKKENHIEDKTSCKKLHFIWWRRCQFKFRWMLNQYSSKMRLNQSFWPEWIPLIWRSLKEPHPGLNFFLPEKKIKTGFSIFFNHRLPGSSISALPPLQYNVAVCYMVIIWHVRSERELYLVYVRTYVCLGWPHINDTKLIFGRGWGRRRNTYEDQAHIFSSIHKNKIAHCFKYFPSMRWVTQWWLQLAIIMIFWALSHFPMKIVV